MNFKINNKKTIIFIIIWIAVIFSFSLQSGKSSNLRSSEIKNTLAPIVHSVGIKTQTIGNLLIKIYHDKNVTPGELLSKNCACD